MRICIVGAGNIGIASAVDLSLKHSVVLLSKKADLPNEFIRIDYDKTIKSNTIKTTNNAKEALCNADIVFVTLPSFLIDDFLRVNEAYFAPPPPPTLCHTTAKNHHLCHRIRQQGAF